MEHSVWTAEARAGATAQLGRLDAQALREILETLMAVDEPAHLASTLIGTVQGMVERRAMAARRNALTPPRR